jgi:hypothetical protein
MKKVGKQAQAVKLDDGQGDKERENQRAGYNSLGPLFSPPEAKRVEKADQSIEKGVHHYQVHSKEIDFIFF